MSPRGQEQNERMRQEAKKKIILAALNVFSVYGYYGTTMEKIKEQSGVSKGLIYHYFPSKEKVFLEVIRNAGMISKRIWEQALKIDGSAWEKIEKLSEVLFQSSFTDENARYFLVIMQAVTQRIEISELPLFMLEHFSHFEWLYPLIAEAQKDGDVRDGEVEVLGASYLALFSGFTMQLISDNEFLKKLSPKDFSDILRKK